jgi:N-acetylglucosaminyldiphosphoundecaprenol N-acetyl-beta-D-mannosaminyltransferase
VALPKNIDNSTIQPLSKLLEDAQMHNILILDFRPVRHIQPEGFALLLNYCRKQRQKNHQFYGFAPTSDIILLMQLHRTWDYFKNNICLSTECLLSRIGHGPNGAEFFDSIYQHGDEVEISFFGALNNAVDYEAYFYKLVPILEGKNCLLDFSYCTYIDTSGFIFLLKIRHLMLDTLKELHIRNLNKSTLAQFKRAKVDSLFRID